MKRLLLARIVCVAMALEVPNSGQAADLCAAPDELTSAVAPLPHVATVLKPAGTFDVLTVGSATVFSPGESLVPGTVTGQALGLGTLRPPGDVAPADDLAFPLQMARSLQAAVPGLKVNVTVRGGRGMTASEMLVIVKSELSQHHYQLVIWQTGTVEAVRSVPAADFVEVLSDGAAIVQDAGADLVLVDPQFSRFLHSNAQLDPYMQAMQEIAARPNAMLFPRYELMRYWAGEGQIDLERTPRGQRQKVAEQLHACIGSKLSRMVQDGANTPPS